MKTTVLEEITVLPEGELLVWQRTYVVVDGETFGGERKSRGVLPGDDVSQEFAQLRAVAQVVHTPECVALFAARQAANAAAGALAMAKEREKAADAKDRAKAQEAVAAAQTAADATRTTMETARAAYETSKHAKVPTKR